MNLFPRNYLQGMHDALVDSGNMHPFPSDDVAMGVFDKIAQEAGLPPILEAQLTKESALVLAQWMKAASDALVRSGAGPRAERIAMAKQAGLYDLNQRAAVTALHLMQKAADEGSLVPSQENSPQNAARHDQFAQLDQSNRPEGTYRTPRGDTSLPTPGVLGREVPAPGAPTTGTTVKAADVDAETMMADAMREHLYGQGVGNKPPRIPLTEQGPSSSGLNRMDLPPTEPAPLVTRQNRTPLADHSESPTLTQRLHQGLDYVAGDAPDQIKGNNLLGRMQGHMHDAGNALRGVGSALATNPLTHLDNVRTGQGAMSQLKKMDPHGQHFSGSYDAARSSRNHGLLGLGGQLAGLAGLAAGARGIYNHVTGPSAEDQGMEVQASEVGPVNRALTFMVGVHNKTGGWVPSEMAKVACAGLGAAGEAGLEAMSTILNRVKTAEGAEGELAHVLQALQEQGIPPSPELVQALSAALGEGGGGAPEAGPPPGMDGGDPSKQASIEDIRHAKDLFNRKGQTFRDAAEMVGESAANATRSGHIQGAAKTVGKGLAGAAAAIGVGIGAKKLLSKKDSEKDASDAFWDQILKAADGSLVPTTPNTEADAASHDQLAKLDAKNRAEGKYRLATQGGTELSTEAGEVGSERKVAEEAEAAYNANLKSAAQIWGPKLPAAMTLDTKRAHVVKIASLAPSLRESYVRSLY